MTTRTVDGGLQQHGRRCQPRHQAAQDRPKKPAHKMAIGGVCGTVVRLPCQSTIAIPTAPQRQCQGRETRRAGSPTGSAICGPPVLPHAARQKAHRDSDDGDHRHHQDGSGEHLDQLQRGSVPPMAGCLVPSMRLAATPPASKPCAWWLGRAPPGSADPGALALRPMRKLQDGDGAISGF